MTKDKIESTLRERFAKPLPDCYDRRIVFWYDSKREFEDILDELDIPDVKLLRLTGDNFFEAKMILSETDTASNYLVYDPIVYAKSYSPKNCAVTFETLFGMNQAQRRELVNGAETIYIYHNKIDAVGDKPLTEKQVFDACADAIDEIKGLVKMIVNQMSGSNIIITADHGFLYSYDPLTESDKADSALVNGKIIEKGRRYIIAENGSSSDLMMNVALNEYSENMTGFAPYDNIRIKIQGGGMNFTHGGVTLQECCVPVITFKNFRAGSKHFVDIKKATIKLISMTRKISNNMFSLDFMQTDAVGGKIVPATYEIYLCDMMSEQVSDVQTIIADKTGEPQERVTKLRFTLKNHDFDSNNKYYLNIVDKDTGDVIEKTEFSIKIAFANDFDF